MRSAALLVLAALAACKPAEQPAAPASPVMTVSAMPPRMQALGTEPFWSVEIAPDGLRYSDPENIEGTAFAATAVPDGAGGRWTGTLRGQPLTLLVLPGACSDGMSDTVYPFKATLERGGQTLSGCARAR